MKGHWVSLEEMRKQIQWKIHFEYNSSRESPLKMPHQVEN